MEERKASSWLLSNLQEENQSNLSPVRLQDKLWETRTNGKEQSLSGKQRSDIINDNRTTDSNKIKEHVENYFSLQCIENNLRGKFVNSFSSESQDKILISRQLSHKKTTNQEEETLPKEFYCYVNEKETNERESFKLTQDSFLKENVMKEELWFTEMEDTSDTTNISHYDNKYSVREKEQSDSEEKEKDDIISSTENSEEKIKLDELKNEKATPDELILVKPNHTSDEGLSEYQAMGLLESFPISMLSLDSFDARGSLMFNQLSGNVHYPVEFDHLNIIISLQSMYVDNSEGINHVNLEYDQSNNLKIFDKDIFAFSMCKETFGNIFDSIEENESIPQVTVTLEKLEHIEENTVKDDAVKNNDKEKTLTADCNQTDLIKRQKKQRRDRTLMDVNKLYFFDSMLQEDRIKPIELMYGRDSHHTYGKRCPDSGSSAGGGGQNGSRPSDKRNKHAGDKNRNRQNNGSGRKENSFNRGGNNNPDKNRSCDDRGRGHRQSGDDDIEEDEGDDEDKIPSIDEDKDKDEKEKVEQQLCSRGPGGGKHGDVSGNHGDERGNQGDVIDPPENDAHRGIPEGAMRMPPDVPPDLLAPVVPVEHPAICINNICDVIGIATSGLPDALPRDLSLQFNVCLTESLHDLSPMTPDLQGSSDGRGNAGMYCCLCLILAGLLKHLADCDMPVRNLECCQCTQIFNLIAWHARMCVQACRERTRVSTGDLCYNVCKHLNWSFDHFNLDNTDRLKIKVKKYLAKVLGSSGSPDEASLPDDELADVTGMSELVGRHEGSPPRSSSNASLSLNGKLVTSPAEEDDTGREVSPSIVCPSGARASASHQGSMTPALPATPTLRPQALRLSSHDSVRQDLSATQSPSPSTPRSSVAAMMPPHPSLPSRGPLSSGSTSPHTPDKQPLIRKPSVRRQAVIPQVIPEDEGLEDGFARMMAERFGSNGNGRGGNDDPYSTQRTYGTEGRHISMPQGQVQEQEQFLSLWNRPRGVPGVGEVVLGHTSQLRIVAKFWETKREDCEKTGICPYQQREEGVILAKHKDKFSILKTRYQKHQQWERLTYLGNGMSGKCHLAWDLKTKFKFCVKKIPLMNYEEEELNLWSEMHHKHIVELYGALRRGKKVYIFSEFIDGGSLESCIREQKALGRRLSHWSAITYFRQLLQVLAYLQKKNMLHEDIKADNILLRKGCPYIAVTDFGTSRRLVNPKELKNKSPVGSPTHWSPEKATSEGHGFPSDLWAAVCVLVQMLSGEPPWLKRFQNAKILHFIIYSRPPPMEDVPSNVQEVVRDLIQRGFVKDPDLRPTASELLAHEAFSLLADGNPESFYSTLTSHSFVEGRRPSNVDNNQVRALTTGLASADAPSNMLYSASITPGVSQESDKRRDSVRSAERAGRNSSSEGGSQKSLESDKRKGSKRGADVRDMNSPNEGGSQKSLRKDSVRGAEGGHGNSLVEEGTKKSPGEEAPEIVGIKTDDQDKETNFTTEASNITVDDVINTAAAVIKTEDDKEDKHQEMEEERAVNNDTSEQTTGNSAQQGATPAMINNAGSCEQSCHCRHPLLQIPNLDLLLPSGNYSDSSASIQSYLEDTTPTLDFNARRSSTLQRYKPEPPQPTNNLPMLSIFDTITQSHSSSNHSSSSISNPLLQRRNATVMVPMTQEMEPMNIKPNLESLAKEQPPSLRQNILTVSSTESENFDSSEMFGSGPLSNVSHFRGLNPQENLPEVAIQPMSPTSPSIKLSGGSNNSNHSSTGLQHKKPTDLRLDIADPVSQKKVNLSSSGRSLTTSTPRKVSNTSGSTTGTGTGTGSSNKPFFSMSSSVLDDAENMVKFFKDELEQSHSSSDSDNLMNLPHLMEEGSREDVEGTSPQDQVPSTPVTISEIKQKFGAARLDGHKICFYNSDRQFLFDAWVESLPLYWRYFIDIVRPTILQHYKHFTLITYTQGTPVSYDGSHTDKHLIVMSLLGANSDCWCQECEIPSFNHVAPMFPED